MKFCDNKDCINHMDVPDSMGKLYRVKPADDSVFLSIYDEAVKCDKPLFEKIEYTRHLFTYKGVPYYLCNLCADI